MTDITITKEQASEMQDLYERKYAINDLCILLASKNELVEEGNLFYDRLIKDNIECMRKMNLFWDNIKKEHSVTLKENEDLFLNFNTGVITIQYKGE